MIKFAKKRVFIVVMDILEGGSTVMQVFNRKSDADKWADSWNDFRLLKTLCNADYQQWGNLGSARVIMMPVNLAGSDVPVTQY